jgi:hypothetical protein
MRSLFQADQKFGDHLEHLAQQVRIKLSNSVVKPLQCGYRVFGHWNLLYVIRLTFPKRMILDGHFFLNRFFNHRRSYITWGER